MATDGVKNVDIGLLAQYRPFDQDGEEQEAVHDDLVAAACQENGGGFPNLEACRQFIKSQWLTELELAEVRDARTRLADLNQAVALGGGIQLTEAATTRFDQEREAWEEAESRAFEEWEVAVRTEFPMLEQDAIDVLREQLRPWLDHVIARHGAEASVLLYPGHERSERIINSFAQADLSFLPDCGKELDAIRIGAFRLFVRNTTVAQREFLGRLLNTAFYLTVLTLDPQARGLAEAEAKGVVLYLDTNFLYSVLGVGGATEAHSAIRLLELCNELGYTLRVTPWTVSELETSIARSRRDVTKMHQSRKAAAIMAQVSGEKGFVKAFWEELRDHGTGPAEFFGKYDHLRRYLSEHGIEEHPEGVAEVEADAEGIARYSSPLEGMFGVGQKDRVVIEHDAKVRLLIETLRGDDPRGGYTDVKYWFLTESTKLPTYARMPIDGDGRPKYPFCILTSTWAQIMRALTPRTAEGLEDVVVGLLASPYVGYRAALHGPARKAVDRVVTRIDSLRDVPPSVAIALVNDDTMARRIGDEVDEDEVDRLVEEGLSKKAEELEGKLIEVARDAAAADQARRTAEAQAIEAAERAEQAAKGLEATQRDKAVELERVREEADSRIAGEQARADATSEEASRARDAALKQANAAADEASRERKGREDAELKADRIETGVAVVSALVIGGISIALLATGTINKRVPAILLISGATAMIFLALHFASSALAKRAVWALTIFFGVAQVVAALWPEDANP